MVTDLRPDVILGTTTAVVDAVRVAGHYHIPSAVYIQSYEILEPSDAERQAWGVPRQKSYRSAEEAAFVFRAADRVFSCSRHMKRFLEGKHGVGSEVLYPEFDDEVMLLGDSDERRPEYITGLCGFRHKGAKIFLGLADAFPGERFLLVGHPTNEVDLGYRRRFEARENIELSGRQRPREFLTKSKLVLVPSQLPEPFGRIAVEALANRIPVLASMTGGLEEIIDDSSMGCEALPGGKLYTSTGIESRGGCCRRRRSRDEGPMVAFYGDTKRRSAYGKAFAHQDDVCLVIKDHSRDPFYRGLTYKREIQDLVTSGLAAEILYIDEFLSTEELASLYRTCDVGVFPYRAEGFCIPILEAMASGVPSMVPNLGAATDFCSNDTSFLMPAVRIRLPIHQHFKTNLGFEEDIDAVDFPEVRVQTLIEFLQRACRASEDDLNRKSLAGIQVARQRHRKSSRLLFNCTFKDGSDRARCRESTAGGDEARPSRRERTRCGRTGAMSFFSKRRCSKAPPLTRRGKTGRMKELLGCWSTIRGVSLPSCI